MQSDESAIASDGGLISATVSVPIGNVAIITHQEMSSPRSGENYLMSAVLSKAIGLEKIFVHHEILGPGRRASAPHCHSTQEEMVFVLRGKPTAIVGSVSYQLKPGDFLGFQPGSKELHFLENTSSEEAEVLVIASPPDRDEINYEKGVAN